MVTSHDSYQARMAYLTSEMEDMARNSQNLMRANVDLKSEVEGLRRAAEEAAKKQQIP